MDKTKEVEEVKTEEQMEEEARRKRYLEDRKNMSMQYYKNVNRSKN